MTVDDGPNIPCEWCERMYMIEQNRLEVEMVPYFNFGGDIEIIQDKFLWSQGKLTDHYNFLLQSIFAVR